MSAKPQAGEDLTGRSRFARNVTFAWGGYSVNIITGFLMPRLISDHLSQGVLGIWDFSWSLVTYFTIIQLGLGGSVNRYVARHRAEGNPDALNRSVSTIAVFLWLACLLVTLVSVVSAWWIVPLFGAQLGEELKTAQWVVLILGLEIAVSFLFSIYNGVLVGCHRWDWHNTVSTITYATLAVGMASVVLAGGGLVLIALVHAVVMTAGEMYRKRLTRAACPELRLDFRLASLTRFKEQAHYSAKSILPRVGEMVSNQSLSFLITYFLGPAMLAIYSRPQNLIRQVQTMSAKFGSILLPTASSLQAQASHDQVRITLLESVRHLGALAMPVAMTMALAGDFVIRLWMGTAYVYPGLVTVMALASLPVWIMEPVWSILAGLNQHGRVGWGKVVGSLLSALALVAAFTLGKCGLLGAAIAFSIPQVIVNAVVSPVIACRRIGLPLGQFYWEAFGRPFVCGLPYALGLGFAVWLLPGHIPLAMGSALLGVIITGLTYWLFILPSSWKKNIQSRMPFRSSATPRFPTDQSLSGTQAKIVEPQPRNP